MAVQPDAAMVAMTIMAVLCSVGVAFYLRFLVALCKECRLRRTCYLVRFQPNSDEYPISKPWEVKASIRRLA